MEKNETLHAAQVRRISTTPPPDAQGQKATHAFLEKMPA